MTHTSTPYFCIKSLIWFLLFTAAISSCKNYVPRRVKKSFTLCYDPTANRANSKLRMNGYYLRKNAPYEVVGYGPNDQAYRYTVDSTFSYMMFFKDGIWVQSRTRSYRDTNYHSYVQSLSNADNLEGEYFYFFQRWGLYSIEEDTLKVQCVNHNHWPNIYWHFSEVWYLILDEKTLKPIYAKDNMNDGASNIDASETVTLEFIETKGALPSSTWLKRHKWFWCEMDDYKKFTHR